MSKAGDTDNITHSHINYHIKQHPTHHSQIHRKLHQKTQRLHYIKKRQFKTYIPQGGVLSPTLSNIYTYDIPAPQVHNKTHHIRRRHHHHIFSFLSCRYTKPIHCLTQSFTVSLCTKRCDRMTARQLQQRALEEMIHRLVCFLALAHQYTST